MSIVLVGQGEGLPVDRTGRTAADRRGQKHHPPR
jgi:hypothetical protein